MAAYSATHHWNLCALPSAAGSHCAVVDLTISFPTLCARWRRGFARPLLAQQTTATWIGIDPCHFYGIPLVARPVSKVNLSSRPGHLRISCVLQIHENQRRMRVRLRVRVRARVGVCVRLWFLPLCVYILICMCVCTVQDSKSG